MIAVVAGLLVLGGLVWVFAIRGEPGGATPRQYATPREAADAGLTTLRELAQRGDIRGLGLTSPEEIKAARLGNPMPVFRVDLDRLQKFNPNDDPQGLLTEVHRLIFPVTVADQVKSSVVVEGPGARAWRATSFGEPGLVTSLSMFRPQGDSLVVQVPALGLYFQAVKGPDGLVLTPVVDDPRLELTAGRSQGAREIFTRLVPVAKEYNGLPI